MHKSTVLIVLAMTAGIGVLLALGTWQVVRMNWKEELIARTQERAARAPVALSGIESQWAENGDVGYMKVSLKGRYDHQREMYYFNTLNAQTGWNVFTPFHLADNRIVLLNRGFVPTAFRDKSTRAAAQIKGIVEVTGLARNPVTKKPNSFIPDNELEDREFFWKSQSQMASLAGESNHAEVLPFTIDAGAIELQGGLPLGGTTRMIFPNSHLQYAITWYGLALALLAVGTVFLYGRRKDVA